MNYLIFDGVILVILLLFALWGRHRGLIMSVCSLCALLVAIVGAFFLSKALAPTVTEWVMPLVEDTVVSAVENVIPEEVTEVFNDLAPGETVKDAVSELLPEDFTLDEGAVLPTVEQIREYLETSDVELPGEVDALLDRIDDKDLETIAESSSVEEAVKTATNTVAGIVIRAVLFLLCFVVILLLWHILAKALDLVARLPVLKTMNKLGGFLFGLVRGVLFLLVAAWLVRSYPTLLDSLIPPEGVEQTYLLNFLLNVKPLEFLASL